MSDLNNQSNEYPLSTRLTIKPHIELKNQNREYLARLTDFLPDIIYIYHLGLERTLFVNRSFTTILGYSQEKLLTNKVTWADIIHPEDQTNRPVIAESIQELADGSTIEYEIRCKTNDDNFIWLHNKLTVFTRDGKGNPEQVLVTSHDITYRKKLEEKLIRQVYTDQLTGLFNRTLFLEELENKISNKTKEFALLFIDLNEFKTINDTHGHNVGDKVIKESAKRLSSLFPHPHILARLGGDEFTVIIDSCKDDKILEFHLNNIHKKFNKKIKLDKLNLDMKVSIGGVLGHTVKKPTCSKLLKLADKEMYRAKRLYYKTKKLFKRSHQDNPIN